MKWMSNSLITLCLTFIVVRHKIVMSDVFRSIVGSKGQVIIPAEVRRRYGFAEGTEVIFTEDNGRLILEPLNFHAIYQLQGICQREPSALHLLEQERNEEREREDRPR